jgi:hypothetical protein
MRSMEAVKSLTRNARSIFAHARPVSRTSRARLTRADAEVRSSREASLVQNGAGLHEVASVQSVLAKHQDIRRSPSAIGAAEWLTTASS